MPGLDASRPCGTFCHMDPIEIGAIVFPRMDQMDFTGPFEVLSRIPGARFHVLWKDKAPARDIRGLILTPETTCAEAPQLDVLVVPGGWGQEQLMDDETVLSFIREQSAHATYVFSVCTGALICGAAGLLKGVRATTHWAAFHLLEYFGAIPTDERIVVDSRSRERKGAVIVSAAGVTAGIDGALRLASRLRGDLVAQQIQLAIEYAPEPPFASGSRLLGADRHCRRPGAPGQPQADSDHAQCSGRRSRGGPGHFQVDHADQRKPVIAPPPPRRRAVVLQSRRLRSRRRPPGCRRAAIGWPAAFARLAGEVLTGNLVLLHNRAHASARSAPRARAGRPGRGTGESAG